MKAIEHQQREKVREIVKNVLDTLPNEPDQKTSSSHATIEHIVVNSLKAQSRGEFDRDDSSRALITEQDLHGLKEGSRLRVAHNVRFTPLAADIIESLKIELVRRQPRQTPVLIRTAAIGCDHGGFKVKEMIKAMLSDLGIVINDFGTNSEEPVDYPDHAHAVARNVGDRRSDIGIIVDGAGIGSAMTANKVPGVRAAACYSVALAKNSREHNGANVLTIGSGQNSPDEIKQIVEAFITTDISEDRHKRRVEKINSVESKYLK